MNDCLLHNNLNTFFEAPPPILPTANNSIEDKKETSNTAFATVATKKSLLNTSYSSEEILLQAASSLQGLEGE